jgi:hypothetical protein
MSSVNAPTSFNSFGSPSDPSVDKAILAVRNLEFLQPKNPGEVIAALSYLEKKLRETDSKSVEGKQLIEQLGRNLCPKKDGKAATELEVHSALLSLQANAERFKASFSYSNTGFAQSIIAGMVDNASKNAASAQKDRISRG